MGIRIHKILGFGLTDVKPNDKTHDLSNDYRFNKNGYMFNPKNYSIKGFIEHVKNKLEKLDDDFEKTKYKLWLYPIEREEKYNDLYNCVYYDSDYGMPNVIVFVPPSSRDWTRYDDIIDYYNPQNYDENGIKNSIIELHRPIWPYDLYMNIKEKPPKTLVGTDFSIYRMVRDSDYKIDDNKLKYKILSDFGFSSVDDFKKYIIPTIPDELIELLKYLEIFSDDKFIYELRPLIYTYWC